ncbi:hypothetical protein CCACVL1_23224, partial [Corchorus capsularis]
NMSNRKTVHVQQPAHLENSTTI